MKVAYLNKLTPKEKEEDEKTKEYKRIINEKWYLNQITLRAEGFTEQEYKAGVLDQLLNKKSLFGDRL